MSQTAETADPSTREQRLRKLGDVVLGVALCVSLLFPATKQASKGTLEGLVIALVLLLLNAVVLVLLSRYVTSPARDVLRRRPAREVSPALAFTTGPVLSREEAAALLDDRGAPADVPGLSITDVGIAVRQGATVTSHANLAWSDCVAVVFSRLPAPGGSVFTSLQFVPLREDLIRRGTRDRRARGAAKVLGLTETAASMVWVAPPQLVHLPPLILAHVQKHHPRVRIVRPAVVEDE
jgi:hypothetical protein